MPSLAPRKKRTHVVESEEESADDIAAIPEADPEEPEGKTSGRLRRLTRTRPADRDSPVSTFCRLFVATAHAACQAFLGHIVDHVQDAEAAAVSELVLHEPKVREAKSTDQRALARASVTSGARVPMARLRLRRRRTDSPSSR